MVDAEPESLSSLLARTPRPGTARAVRIATQLLDAVKGGTRLVGLSSQRVLLAGDEVRVVGQGAGGDGAEYAAPETSLGEEVDERADVYAVGALLYEMLAGRRPFEGKSRKELVSAHLLKEPPRLRELAPEVDESLEAAVM